MPRKEYPRRIYHNPAELLRDLRAVRRERRRVRALHNGESVNAAFRERLMLAVTQVNGCRYCTYVHAKAALRAGVGFADVAALADGAIEGCPREQIPALLYAQHWAESDGKPDPEARQRVLETYGEAGTEAVELSLRAIRVGNLVGNSVDYLLYRASFGRLGNGQR